MLNQQEHGYKAKLKKIIQEKMDLMTLQPASDWIQYNTRLGEINGYKECLELFERYQHNGDEL